LSRRFAGGMRRGAVAIGLAAASLAGCAPSSHDYLAGAWETHLSRDDACGFELHELQGGADAALPPTEVILRLLCAV
jgi:hypothetical protein